MNSTICSVSNHILHETRDGIDILNSFDAESKVISTRVGGGEIYDLFKASITII